MNLRLYQAAYKKNTPLDAQQIAFEQASGCDTTMARNSLNTD
jgi:hypothetical protein